jgi:uncharacterized protein
MKKIAIVTGASSGLGREFALQLSGGHAVDEIWLTDLKGPKLTEIEKTIMGGVAMPADLCSRKDLDALVRKIQGASPEIVALVNCAGFSRVADFQETPLGVHLSMIDLNVRALVELTYACLPFMKRGSVIYQVASISAFLPGPKTAVYSASKAFVLSFANALYQEQKERGVHVISVSPGPMDTQFWSTATGGERSAPPNAIKPSDVVRAAMADAAKGRVNSTRGFMPRLITFLPRILGRKALLKLAAST